MNTIASFNNYGRMLGAGDPYSGSTQIYLNELASIERRISDIEIQLQSSALEQSTRNDMQSERVRLMARKSAINKWLKLSREQKNKVNAIDYVNRLTQTFLNPLNKIKNQYQEGGLDFLNTNIAGFPLWLGIGLAGAVIYMLKS